MSRTSQRKESAYKEGFECGKVGLEYNKRWARRYVFRSEFLKGYAAGKLKRNTPQCISYYDI